MSGRKTQVHTKLPWTGGLNTALDPGVISDNDLTIADNIVFASSGARIKREGFQYLDSDIPEIVAISSSGTTRTIIFKDPINTTSNDILVAGEAITITADSYSDFEGDFDIATVTDYVPSTDAFVDGDVDVADDEITLTAHGYYTGLVGQLTTTGTLPAGLALTTDYYIIVIDEDTVSLASSLEDAIAGTAVDITAAAGTGTHTFTPAALSTDNALTYTASGSLTLPVTSILDQADISIIKSSKSLGVYEYWYVDSDVKVREIIQVTDQPKLFTYNPSSGNRKEITKDSGATALDSPTKVTFLVAQNTLIMAFDGVANTPKKYYPISDADWFDLPNAPNFSTMQLYLGRIFANDKTDLDRLHYSSPFDIETWNGAGDSGAIDISQGDGDSSGIIAIANPFKSRMFVSKGNKIIDLRGDSPENFKPETITEGLGMRSQNAIVPVDVDDLMFISSRGIHSMAATDTQGDFEGAFLSQKIQPSFKGFTPGRLEFTSGCYIPNLNSVLYAVSEGGSITNNSIYAYNILQKEWYRWPNTDAQFITTYTSASNSYRPMFGDSFGRVVLANSDIYTDFDSDPIVYEIKSGTIYPNNDPKGLKMFKRICLYFRPTGDFIFSVNYKIDNQASQTISFEQEASTDLLGASFILGSSILGVSTTFAPHSKSIDGIGRGITITITSNDASSTMELYGYDIEWEYADINQEVI